MAANTNTSGDGELKLCKCDGFWHISIPDGDSHITKYVDTSEFEAHTRQQVQNARVDEIHRMLGHPKKGEIGYEAVKSRLAKLKQEYKTGEKDG